MKIDIQIDDQGHGCTVIIGENSISFASTGEAETYVAQLKERLQAAPHAFAASPEALA